MLVDTGCRIDGYHSDLTRTYVLETPSEAFAEAWATSVEAQQAAVFEAACSGGFCGSVDDAARRALRKNALDPDYDLRRVYRTAPATDWVS